MTELTGIIAPLHCTRPRVARSRCGILDQCKALLTQLWFAALGVGSGCPALYRAS